VSGDDGYDDISVEDAVEALDSDNLGDTTKRGRKTEAKRQLKSDSPTSRKRRSDGLSYRHLHSTSTSPLISLRLSLFFHLITAITAGELDYSPRYKCLSPPGEVCDPQLRHPCRSSDRRTRPQVVEGPGKEGQLRTAPKRLADREILQSTGSVGVRDHQADVTCDRFKLRAHTPA
jgi:hypothetical protein